jgi:hypothetical protein
MMTRTAFLLITFAWSGALVEPRKHADEDDDLREEPAEVSLAERGGCLAHGKNQDACCADPACKYGWKGCSYLPPGASRGANGDLCPDSDTYTGQIESGNKRVSALKDKFEQGPSEDMVSGGAPETGVDVGDIKQRLSEQFDADADGEPYTGQYEPGQDRVSDLKQRFENPRSDDTDNDEGDDNDDTDEGASTGTVAARRKLFETHGFGPGGASDGATAPRPKPASTGNVAARMKQYENLDHYMGNERGPVVSGGAPARTSSWRTSRSS